MKRNWKVLNGLIGKIKQILHKEFIVYGVSINATAKTCTSFCKKFDDQPRNTHDYIPVHRYHRLDQIEYHDGSMFFGHATETLTKVSNLSLNKDVISEISH